jgi:hypothetical protein
VAVDVMLDGKLGLRLGRLTLFLETLDLGFSCPAST